MWTAVIGVCATLVFLAASASAAAASSGEFTRAEANGDWTLGAVSGSASWSGCPAGREECSLQAFVTVGPGSQAPECSEAARQWPHSGGQLTLVWESEETAHEGSSTFDVSEVPLSGGTEQLACLSVLESYLERPECQLHPEPGIACPMYVMVARDYAVLAAATLTSPTPPPPTDEGPPTLTGIPVVGGTLTCSDGSWEGAEGLSRTWLRNGVGIAGQTGRTYLLASADQGQAIACEVTASGSGGSTSARSGAVTIGPALSPPSGGEPNPPTGANPEGEWRVALPPPVAAPSGEGAPVPASGATPAGPSPARAFPSLRRRHRHHARRRCERRGRRHGRRSHGKRARCIRVRGARPARSS